MLEKFENSVTKQADKEINPKVELEKILVKYKRCSLVDIPDDELSAIGYEKIIKKIVDQEDVVTIKPIGYSQKKQEEHESKLAEKIRHTPFGPIEVFLSKKEISSRRLSPAEFKALETRIREIEYLAELPNLELDVEKEYFERMVSEYKGSPLAFLRDNFLEFIESSKVNFGADRNNLSFDIFSSDSLLSLITWGVNNFSERIREMSDYDRDEHGEIFLSAPKALNYFELLEKSKGFFSDLPAFERIWQEHLNYPYLEMHDYDRKESPQIFNYCRKNNLVTCQDVIVNLFATYLEGKHLPEVAKEVRDAKNIKEINNLLITEQKNLPRDWVEKEKRLKERIKQATIEEKKELSSQLKDIQETKEGRKKILLGLEQFFSSPAIAVQFFNRIIKELQDCLVHKGDKVEVDFYLDASVDAKYDKDPGQVSGDCTKGMPLPFLESNYAYNVKVFEGNGEARKHVGNQYLLETKELASDKKVWHFDAIQVPRSNVDWEMAVEAIIGRIAQEAERKEIDFITVNEQSMSISNYDYIREAVDRFWLRQGLGTIDVGIPEVKQRGYSSFQGDGSAKVLWKR